MSPRAPRRLHACFEGRVVATIDASAAGPRFAYEATWLRDPGRFPLSLALPLDGPTPAPERVENVLWNLLPDNELTLARQASRFRWGEIARSSRRPPAHASIDRMGKMTMAETEQPQASSG